jgi:hypothetical protein
MLDGTTYGLLGGLVLLHLLTLAYAYRRRAGGAGGTEGVVEREPSVDARPLPDGFDADADTVACEACDTVNAAEYAFCRACVSELPTRTPTVEGGAGTFRSGSA